MHRTTAPTLGFALFPTALGHCGIAWSEYAITGCQLPCATAEQTEGLMHQRFFRGCANTSPRLGGSDCCRCDGAAGGRHQRPRPPGKSTTGHGAGTCPFTAKCGRRRGAFPWARRFYMANWQACWASRALRGQSGRHWGRTRLPRSCPATVFLAKGQGGGGFSAPGGVDTKLRMLQMERARFGGPGLFDGL